MTIASSTDVFFDQLKDLKSATEQTLQTLPDLIDWSSSPGLHEELAAYAGDTRDHVEHILGIFARHAREPGDDQCKAMAGLIEGGNSHLEMAADAVVRDHLLIAHSNRIGHYLQGASEFTLAMARKCEFSAEADALAGMLARHQRFIRSLAAVGASALGIEMGGSA